MRALAVIALVVVAVVVALWACTEDVGLGGFDQEIRVETDKPIRRVTYCSCRVDERTRRLAEDTATRPFEWLSPGRAAGGYWLGAV